MATVVKPNTFQNGQTADGTQVNSNFDTIYNDYNGNITDVNIAASGITSYGKVQGSAIANLANISPTAGALPVANVPAADTLSLTDVTTNNASTTKHGFLKKLSNVATEFMNGAGNWVAVTIDSILPTQTGNSGKFLTTNGSVSSWGSAIPALNPDANTVVASAILEKTHSTSTYTKLKEITMFGNGTVTVSFQLKSPDTAQVYAKVYINSSAVGTERGRTASTYTTFTENFTVQHGDKIQLYARAVAGSVTVQSMQILATQYTIDLN